VARDPVRDEILRFAQNDTIMCLIGIAYRPGPQPGLVLAANRDEFYERPSAPAQAWADAPDVFGGRDLKSGGSGPDEWRWFTRQSRRR